jgi:SAM-dependent methyltransferase
MRMTVSDDFEQNRRAWDAASDEYQKRHREQLAARPDAWGIWSQPEADLELLGPVDGRDILEYGCGGALWSIALAAKGGRCTGIDNSARQLEHARAAIEASSAVVTLVHGNAESTPFAEGSFDIVFCDHGAMSFADPERTIPDVARILRPGGIFAFSVEHPMHAMAWGDAEGAPTRELRRSYFALGRFLDPEDGMVSYARPVSTYVSLLIEHGFVIEKLLEPKAPERAQTTYGEYASLAWATEFPGELMIRARRS